MTCYNETYEFVQPFLMGTIICDDLQNDTKYLVKYNYISF